MHVTLPKCAGAPHVCRHARLACDVLLATITARHCESARPCCAVVRAPRRRSAMRHRATCVRCRGAHGGSRDAARWHAGGLRTEDFLRGCWGERKGLWAVDERALPAAIRSSCALGIWIRAVIRASFSGVGEGPVLGEARANCRIGPGLETTTSSPQMRRYYQELSLSLSV